MKERGMREMKFNSFKVQFMGFNSFFAICKTDPSPFNSFFAICKTHPQPALKAEACTVAHLQNTAGAVGQRLRAGHF